MTAFLLCHFEEDECDWSIAADDGDYRWQRKSANELMDNEINDAPSGDLDNKKDKHFMIASGQLTPAASEESRTELVSPEFTIQDHPKECFNFWFFIGVRKLAMIFLR